MNRTGVNRMRHYPFRRFCPDCHQPLSERDIANARLYKGRCVNCMHNRLEHDAAEQVARYGGRTWWAE